MPKLISLIILSSYILQISITSFPLIDYILNYDNISTNLCENKELPELDCNGKCYLYKESRKAQEDKEEKESIISEKLSLEYLNFQLFEFNRSIVFYSKEFVSFAYLDIKYSIKSSIDLPPPK